MPIELELKAASRNDANDRCELDPTIFLLGDMNNSVRLQQNRTWKIQYSSWWRITKGWHILMKRIQKRRENHNGVSTSQQLLLVRRIEWWLIRKHACETQDSNLSNERALYYDATQNDRRKIGITLESQNGRIVFYHSVIFCMTEIKI